MPKFKKTDPQFRMQGEFGVLMDKDKRHVEQRYKVKKRTEAGGKVILELTPLKPVQERRKELVSDLAESLAKEINSVDLMKDILSDVELESLEKLKVAMDRGAKIKHDHCFGLQIKDPRKKLPYRIKIRS